MKYPYISYIWWYHRPSTPTGPLPKNGNRHFKFTLSHSMDKKSHHTKFYQNWLKNNVVKTIFLPPQICGKFVQKYEILKFGQIQFFTPDEVGFPRGCSFLRFWGSYNACLAKLGWNHHLFHEISHLMLFHIREDWLKTIKFVQKYEILKFPQLEFSWIVNKTS